MLKTRTSRIIAITLCALLFFVLIAALSFDLILKTVAEMRLRAETGMNAHIGKFALGLAAPTLEIRDLKLENLPQFGRDIFLNMPELYLEYDRDALRSGRIHFNLVRINIEKIHLVENADGIKNVDVLQNRQLSTQKLFPRSSQKNQPDWIFDSIDLLDVTINSVQFTTARTTNQNFSEQLGIRHEKFRNLKTELDFQTAEAVLILKAGLSGALNLDSFWSGKPKKSRTVNADIMTNQSTTNR